MRILGLDPGYALCGFGIIDAYNDKLRVVQFGCFSTTPDMQFQERLLYIYRALCQKIEQHKPDIIAIEELFFARNSTTAIAAAESRGVLILAAAQYKIPLFEYKPIQVKKAVTGHGKADKKQVQEMVRILLKLDKIPRPDDAADALAIAICQANNGILPEFKLRGAYNINRDY